MRLWALSAHSKTPAPRASSEIRGPVFKPKKGGSHHALNGRTTIIRDTQTVRKIVQSDSMRRLALLDWDGTLRRGYTIVPWVKQLVRVGVLSKNCKEGLLQFFLDYKKESISHDDLARLTAGMYAKHLRGQLKARLKDQARIFVNSDQNALFKWSRELMTRLKSSNISTIVISGAPIEVLEAFQRPLQLDVVYGLDLEVENGVYTGRVRLNPGISTVKKRVVDELARVTKGGSVLIAFGDSSSDMPLFDSAKVSVMVGDKLLPSQRVSHRITNRTSSKQIQEIITHATTPEVHRD